MFSYYPTSSFSSQPNPYDYYPSQLALRRQRELELERAAREQYLERQIFARAQLLAQQERRAREEQAFIDIMNARKQNQTVSSSTEPEESQAEFPEAADKSLATLETTSHSPQQEACASDTPSLEVQEAAASIIQSKYRIHRSLRTLTAIQSQFQSLKAQFSLPSTLEFVVDGQTVSFAVENSESSTLSDQSSVKAKLGYTANNLPVHAHIESLSRLLVALDAVESWGSSKVRQERKKIVEAVEQEAEAIEMRVQNVYKAGIDSK